MRSRFAGSLSGILPGHIPQDQNVSATTHPPADSAYDIEPANKVKDTNDLVENGMKVEVIIMITIMVSKRARLVVRVTTLNSRPVVSLSKASAVRWINIGFAL